MSRKDYPALLVRAKKVAGALKSIPSEGDLIERFEKNGTKINVAVARDLIKDVQTHWNAKTSKAKPTPTKRVRGSKTVAQVPAPVAAAPAPIPTPAPDHGYGAVEQPKVEQKPEVASTPTPVANRYGGATRTTSYGRR